MYQSFHNFFTENEYPNKKFAVTTFNTRKKSRIFGNSLTFGAGAAFHKSEIIKGFIEERISLYSIEFVFAQFVLAITWSRTNKVS